MKESKRAYDIFEMMTDQRPKMLNYVNKEKKEYQKFKNLEIEKPLKDIVINILNFQAKNPRYKTQQYTTGQIGFEDNTCIIPSLDNPKSLMKSNYHILFNWGRTLEEYAKEEFAVTGIKIDPELIILPDTSEILKLNEIQGITFLNWNKNNYFNYPKSREGYEKLEELIRNIK